MTCPDDNILVAFATAGLSGAERARVERHLDECSLCGVLVAEAARDPSTRAEPPPSLGDGVTSPGRLLRGTSLGRYLVLEPLGSGGLGDVYACYDPELDRRVAIKLLRTHDGAIERAQLRLKREAQALARLAHPNVVAVHDVGVHGDRVFVAMELVDGQTLRQWLALRSRAWTEIRDVMVAAGRGLAAAHDAGIVHRDFKPGNMMVGADGRVRVLDFGLARAVTPADPTVGAAAIDAGPRSSGAMLDAAVTRTGMVLGTPAYMAPEQLVARNVDAHADQFGFCCTLYEALGGQRPFAGRSLQEQEDAIRAGPPAPPDGHQGPPWLWRVIVRGLSFDPGDRFESMSALLDAMVRDRRSRRLRAIALVGIVLAGGTGILVGRAMVPPSQAEFDAIEQLEAQVHEAAARGDFVYPPADDPQAHTALDGVQQLEDHGHRAARARAAALRDELAQTLVRLGDRYWDREGGRPFAVEYYVQALVFDPSSTRATERAGLLAARLDTLRDTIETRAFSQAELETAAPLAALAIDDPQLRRDRLRAVASRGALSPMIVGWLGALEPEALEPPDSSPVAIAIPSGVDRGATPSPEERPPDLDPAGQASAAPSVSDDATERPPEPSRTRRDPKAAAAATSAGRDALARGGRAGLEKAERSFHRALEADSRHTPAVAGLAEVAFERGHFAQAERLARRAIKAEPRRGRHRILLGDSLRRQHEYAAARTAYEAARSLGHAKADARLRSLDALTQP